MPTYYPTTSAVFKTQQPLPESHAARRKPDFIGDEMEAVSVIGSAIGGEEEIELPPKKGAPLTIAESEGSDFKRLKAEEIRAKIQKREENIKKVKKPFLSKRNVEECLSYLKANEGI